MCYLNIIITDQSWNIYKGDNMKKKGIRKQILELRKNQSQAAMAQKSGQIFDHLINWPVFANADALLIYMDFRSEVQTKQIIDYCFEQGKDVIVPVVDDSTGQLALIQIDKDSAFIESKMGILEPPITEDSKRTLYDVDLVLAPGVAFDLDGNRLGYGGGYYDRLLDKYADIRHLIKIYGLAFECQLVDSVPTEPTDYKMDGIITEKQIYHCRKEAD